VILFQNKDAKSTSNVLEREPPLHLFVPIAAFVSYNKSKSDYHVPR
jgi:hypothetical protein